MPTWLPWLLLTFLLAPVVAPAAPPSYSQTAAGDPAACLAAVAACRDSATQARAAGNYNIYVTGGASLAPGVVDRLTERFRKPVLRLPFIAGDTRAVPAADIEMANAVAGIALGCALTQLGAPGLRLEFRREDLRYARKFDLVKVALASTVSLVFILLFLDDFHSSSSICCRTCLSRSRSFAAFSNQALPIVRRNCR